MLPFVAAHAQSLPNTAPITFEGDRSAAMVAGITRYFENETAAAAAQRAKFWHVDLSGDRAAYEKSVEPNRQHLARILGVVDARPATIDLEFVATTDRPGKLAESDRFEVYAVRWPALDGVHGEGLLLEPRERARANVVALPDADQLPEAIAGLNSDLPPARQYARLLADAGCRVLVPTLVDRTDEFSGNPSLKLFTNRPHREWIYRQAYTLGRHPIGYEVQKVLAAVDWFVASHNPQSAIRNPPLPIGVVGWGEGGLLAFYSAALDRRIDVALVSGYFAPREKLWAEPIYRNVFGLLNEFGDAEIARLIAPRALLIEHGPVPKVDGPPAARPGRTGAAPGAIVQPALAEVRREFGRARSLVAAKGDAFALYHGEDEQPIGPMAEHALHGFLRAVGIDGFANPQSAIRNPQSPSLSSARARQQRTVREIEAHCQRLLALSTGARDEFLWKKVKPTAAEAWHDAMGAYRERAWVDYIGKLAPSMVPLNPRTRVLAEKPTVTLHEVMLDVAPDIFAWGYLVVPKDIKPGDHRPVVVCQHGVGGLPESVTTEDPTSRAYQTYRAFAVRLAERGFITFAPHNPYRGDDPSRMLQRHANPLGKTIFSVILAQHERILGFLSSLPPVDPRRIAFYGLSYGGQTAMRVPVILERYAVSICSGDFNEWTVKNTSTALPWSYTFNAAWERPDFDMGMTFGYAELAALMVPRPFMVERGHNDAVGVDEWIAYEYAKVRRLYAKLGIPQQTEIEFFDGPHMINGQGTFQFLHRNLQWPEQK